jgi:glycosyltransferase involved in cell wall biosynthesis
MIKLSICIATHNRGFFLDQTLKSLTNQLTDECEVVIYDSLSTDNTFEVFEKYNKT